VAGDEHAAKGAPSKLQAALRPELLSGSLIVKPKPGKVSEVGSVGVDVKVTEGAVLSMTVKAPPR
jgi:hypothetical protein